MIFQIPRNPEQHSTSKTTPREISLVPHTASEMYRNAREIKTDIEADDEKCNGVEDNHGEVNHGEDNDGENNDGGDREGIELGIESDIESDNEAVSTSNFSSPHSPNTIQMNKH